VTAAEKDLNTALLHDPKHVKARELLVGVLLRDGRRDEAQLLLKAGLDEVPAQSSFTLLLARLYFDQGAESEALGLLEAVRDNARANADYQTFLATLYQRAGRHGEAVTAYRQAIGMRPTEGKWWLGLAISLEAQEESVQARGAYQRAARSGDLDGKLLSYAQSRMENLRRK
jgi:MSHA biogenesis protein MshN